jgi:LPPG:FO 2-phospho-L-lactate transferase
MGVKCAVLPMTDDQVRTLVLTAEGEMSFQTYFVALGCEPAVRGFRFSGVETAHPAPGVLEALAQADVIVMCPSNPWVSLDPILALAGVRQAVGRGVAVAVSPIVGGQALKGPAAKMFREMGIEPSAQSVAAHFEGLIRGLVMDVEDAKQASAIKASGIQTLVTQTVMRGRIARRRLAEDVLEFGRRLNG